MECFAGWESIVASTGIIHTGQAPQAIRAPPATGLFINTWPGRVSKNRVVLEVRGLHGDLEEASVSETSTFLLLSLSTRRNEVRRTFLPATDLKLGPGTSRSEER